MTPFVRRGFIQDTLSQFGPFELVTISTTASETIMIKCTDVQFYKRSCVSLQIVKMSYRRPVDITC